MIKFITILISIACFSCKLKNKEENINLDKIPIINYSGNISQVINSEEDILRLSMDSNSFSIFKTINSDKWKEWHDYPNALYVTTKNNVDYIFNFSDLSYSVFRDDRKDYSNLVIWRPGINELWVIRVTLIM